MQGLFLTDAAIKIAKCKIEQSNCFLNLLWLLYLYSLRVIPEVNTINCTPFISIQRIIRSTGIVNVQCKLSDLLKWLTLPTNLFSSKKSLAE